MSGRACISGARPRGGAVALARIAAACILAAACLLAAPAPAEVRSDELIPLSAFPREPIVIETRSARRHELDAWRADTPQTREQGLMFVREMRAGQSMIFVYDPPLYVSMWMKNTLLPLDMLFVDKYGCVVKVKHDARPESLAIISADGPVALVVELKAGVATTLSVDTGDRVLRPEARWPAEQRSCASGN
jgi:uncharacterized membrane protein (UPF0127 family)